MESKDLAEIVRGITSEEMPEGEADISDADEFCTLVGDWVSQLNSVATDESGVMVQKGHSFVVQAMEGEAVAEILDRGLESDTDTDSTHLYIDALGELKEMASEMQAAYPRTYARLENTVLMRI